MTWFRTSAVVAVGLSVAMAFAGCDDDADSDDNGSADVLVPGAGDAGTGGGAAPMGGSGGDVPMGGSGGSDAPMGGSGGDFDPGPAGVPDSGLWFLNINIVEFGNLELPMQLELETEVSEAGGGTITRAVLRAAKDGAVSEPLGEVTDVAVDAAGRFELSFAGRVLPAEYSPSGSDVELSVNFGGLAHARYMCGNVTGEVVSLGVALEASTFAAVPWGTEGDAPPSACEGEGPSFTRVEACPALVEGDNEDFASGGLMRHFRVILPDGYSDDGAYPLVFLFHGILESPDRFGLVDQILAETDFEARSDAEGFILVVPVSQPDLGTEWSYSSFSDNADLVFFDDMVKCVEESFAVDSMRIHSVGHSGGALNTVYLSMQRPDVLASVGFSSGGLLIDFNDPDPAIPVLMAWGGEEDVAYGQNFQTFADSLIESYGDNGNFTVACNHGDLDPPADADADWSRHAWRIEATDWITRFLMDHPKGVDPLPYGGGLPGSYPELCRVVNP